MRNYDKEVERYLGAYQVLVESLEIYSHPMAKVWRDSVQETVNKIEEERRLGSLPYREALAGLKQGIRQLQEVLYWLPPIEAERITAMVMKELNGP